MNRKPPSSLAVGSPAATDHRSRQAWLAHKRQELRAPASALLARSEMLLADAADRDHADFQRDQQEVHAAASRLLARIDEVLDPLHPADGQDELARRIRHELRTPLTEIIGLCEFWLEDAAEQFLEAFVEDLQTMVQLAKTLVADLDGLLDFGKTASDPDIDLDRIGPGEVELIRALVHSLPVADEGPAGRPRQSGTLLVVDDNPINRDVLSRRLARDGHTVVEAADGRQGLALARAREFDLILLDMVMPQMNGLQMLEQLKADPRLRHVPVIVISAFHELDGVARCLEIGAEDYLAKPFNPVLLRARIDGCLEKKRLRDREGRYREEIERQRRRADELLRVILPDQVVQELKAVQVVKPRRHEDVAVLFCDIVGFTPFGAGAGPEEVVGHLQTLIEWWEEIALGHGVEKIKTVGDSLMATAGLLHATANPVLSCLRCGLDLIAVCRSAVPGWDLRVGIHVGPVVAGVIGRRQYRFDVWGDTVNVAARMEGHGVPGSVTLSATAWQRVARLCRGESCGPASLKGQGTMEMFRFDGFLGG
jgi:CheY-like chemotaxis protein